MSCEGNLHNSQLITRTNFEANVTTCLRAIAQICIYMSPPNHRHCNQNEAGSKSIREKIITIIFLMFIMSVFKVEISQIPI